jgi:hypothetical protein
MEKHNPPHRQNLLALNFKALERGAEFAAGVVQSVK